MAYILQRNVTIYNTVTASSQEENKECTRTSTLGKLWYLDVTTIISAHTSSGF